MNNTYEVMFNGCTIQTQCIGELESSLAQEIYDYLHTITYSDPHAERDLEEWAERLFYVAMDDLIITCGRCDKVNDHTYENSTVCKCGQDLYLPADVKCKGE
tara:strand:+ start:477 stop:782 length:306 start_codon:yes stop_codon:yes gene_type:complete